MASTFTPSIGLELQAPGENNNAWGARLNANGIALLDERIDGVASKAVTGDFTIIIQNMIASDGRKAVQLMTGTPAGDFTVTLPERMLNRWFHNKTGKTATISLGTGATCAVRDGQLSFVYADPALGCFVHDPTLDTIKAPAADVSMGGKTFTGLADGISPQSPVTMGQLPPLLQPYVDAAEDAQAIAEDAADAAALSETQAATSERNAGNFADAAALSAASLTGTSTTSLAIGLGTKVFTTQAGKFFEAGARVIATSDASPAANSMFGVVTDYAVGTLTVAVLATTGSGTYADWTIRISGEIGPIGPSGAVNLIRSARTSNTLLTTTDIGTLIDITSGAFTQTFAAAATLGSGWWCYLRNSGTGDITLDPNAAETIDGLASYVMYPGEMRLVQCDGVALRSAVLNAFSKTFIASATFTKPPGYAAFDCELWGGGGGGGKAPTGDYCGGSGGAGFPFKRRPADLSATAPVTIGAGGVGSTADNVSGTAGGSSSFAGVTCGGGAGGANTSRGGDVAGSSTYALFSIGSTTLEGAFYAGGSPSVTNKGGTIWGGAAGGAYLSSFMFPAFSTIFGGAGGAGGDTTSGADGSAPGGGGGVTRTGTKGGNGARGELRLIGVI